MWDEAGLALGGLGVELRLAEASQLIEFDYLHSLSKPKISYKKHTRSSFTVKGDCVVRFGMLDADPVVDAEIAVFDPQSAEPEFFSTNGSKANRLAIVISDNEFLRQVNSLTAHQRKDAIGALLGRHGADVIVVKAGVQGGTVYFPNRAPYVYPAYKTPRVFKIGSGDVFTAAFAHFWAERKMDAEEAAEAASRSTAHYCHYQHLPLPPISQIGEYESIYFSGGRDRIYIAGPFFSLSQRWLVNEVREIFWRLGIDVISPIHDIGVGPADFIAKKDLEELSRCKVVFAMLDGNDPGTIFEIGYAISQGLKVVIFSTDMRKHECTMFKGSHCRIFSDFTTAIYHAAWELAG